MAEKIAGKKVRASYLSTFIGTFYNINYIDTISKNVFVPIPKVDSAIIQLVLKDSVEEIKDVLSYESFLHKGFRFPKKMLNKAFDKPFLEKAGLTGDERPHNLTVDMWIKLYNEAYDI